MQKNKKTEFQATDLPSLVFVSNMCGAPTFKLGKSFQISFLLL
jgi:hypothetical protein